MTESASTENAAHRTADVSWSSRIKVAQDFLALSKAFVTLLLGVIVLYVMLIHRDVVGGLFTHFANELSKKKIEAVTIAGVKVDLQDSVQKLDTAKVSLDSTKKMLDELAAKATDPAMKNKLEKLSAELSTAVTATDSAQAGIQAGIKEQDRSIAAAEGPTSDGNWYVVVSADKDKEAAQYEVKQLDKLGFKGAKIFERKGWLRTVVPFSSRVDAEVALGKIREGRRSTAYLAIADAWCPRAQQDPSTGLLACTGGNSPD